MNNLKEDHAIEKVLIDNKLLLLEIEKLKNELKNISNELNNSTYDEAGYCQLITNQEGHFFYQLKYDHNTNEVKSSHFSFLCEDITGYTSNELISDPKKLIRNIHKKDKEIILDRIKTLKKNLGKSILKYRLLQKNNSYKKVIHHIYIYKLDDNLIEEGYIFDVSSIHCNDTNMKKLNQALEQTADSVLITDKNGIIEYVNSAFEKLTGFNKKEVLGQTPRILKSNDHDDIFYEQLWKTILEGDSYRTQMANIKKNGQLYYEGKTITPIRNEHCEITHFISTGKDITENKRLEKALRFSEQQLYSILSSSPDLIFVVNKALIIEDIFTGRDDLLWGSKYDIIGSSLIEHLSYESVKSIKVELEKINDSKRAGQLEIKTEINDKLQYWSVSASIFTTDLYRNGKYLLAFRDQTEKVLFEQLKEDIERMIQHDLKNPLNSIFGFAELLKEENQNEDLKEYIDAISFSSNHMIKIIESSLNFTKIEKGNYNLNISKINLSNLINQLIQQLRLIIKSKNIDIKLLYNNNSLNENIYYLGDDILIENMFANLLKNAVEASPERKSITISFYSVESGLYTEIHNYGEIPSEIRDRFFEKYVTARKTKGTGLGTYSAYLSCKAHKGTISFDSSEEDGTTLKIFLPNNMINQ